MIRMDKQKVIESMMKYEGFEFEEAKLTYAAREHLPESVFCGPDRTYPAQDAAHVRNAFVRLATFGSRLPTSTRASILRCLCGRAKKFGIESKFCVKGKTKTKTEETVEWFLSQSETENVLEEYGVEEAAKLWIQGAIQKKGALRSQLGIKEGETIPAEILQKIANADVGDKVTFRGKILTVTGTLKKRAVLALTLHKLPRRTK